MRIDYEIIKRYLKVFQENERHLINTIELFDRLEYDSDNQKDCQEAYHYLHQLNDQELIDCIHDKEELGFILLGNGGINLRVTDFRLTHLGHQTYEAMNSSKIWSKINGMISKLGDSGLKQIPTLAVKMIMENI